MSTSHSVQIEQLPGLLIGRFRAMASPCEILLDGGDAGRDAALLRQAAQEAWRIEHKFSRYRGDSVVSRINQSSGTNISLDGETARLIDYAEQCWRLSDGRFDITSGILRRAWTFDGSDRLPEDAIVQALLPHIGWQKVHWKSPHLSLPAGMEIDLGGIGKEYAVDRVLERLAARTTLPCLVNFGGDLRASGSRERGIPWQVGIDTRGTDRADARVELISGALATSGDAHRFLQKAGHRYSHVLDPRTGWPVEGAAASVTVAADTCIEAGTLATLAMLLGPEAEEFLKENAERYWLRPSSS